MNDPIGPISPTPPETDDQFARRWFEFQQVIALLVISAFIALTGLFFVYRPDFTQPNREIALMLITGLTAFCTTAVNYLFRRD